MEQETVPSIFDGIHDTTAVRRKDMIPKWIRFFCWLFAILCPVGLVVSFVIDMIQGTYNLSIYGMHADELFSVLSIVSIVSFIIKGIAAIGLLAEKNWAVKVAITDGILSTCLATYSLIFYAWTINGNFSGFNLRLELLLIIPYLVKMVRIRKDWEENKYAHPGVVQV